ncbi:MAG TPA: DUF305 domain-containing protein [Mycobacteriales bacterium]|nr:DUF305 domain-containing protein [Mycobacteriales bacterium]
MIATPAGRKAGIVAAGQKAGIVAAALLWTGLTTSCASSLPAHNAADATFLQDMLPHHQQAIAVAQIAARAGVDPRTRTFGGRVIAEQTPEVRRIQDMAKALRLHIDLAAGAAMAVHRISPAELSALDQQHGLALDRRFLALSITSEQGAVAMARTELAHGRYAPARALATSIAGAPGGEIPQLQALLSALAGGVAAAAN